MRPVEGLLIMEELCEFFHVKKKCGMVSKYWKTLEVLVGVLSSLVITPTSFFHKTFQFFQIPRFSNEGLLAMEDLWEFFEVKKKCGIGFKYWKALEVLAGVLSSLVIPPVSFFHQKFSNCQKITTIANSNDLPRRTKFQSFLFFFSSPPENNGLKMPFRIKNKKSEDGNEIKIERRWNVKCFPKSKKLWAVNQFSLIVTLTDVWGGRVEDRQMIGGNNDVDIVTLAYDFANPNKEDKEWCYCCLCFLGKRAEISIALKNVAISGLQAIRYRQIIFMIAIYWNFKSFTVIWGGPYRCVFMCAGVLCQQIR